MARLDPQIAAHLEWIGFVRPTGLVVSAPALVKAGAHLNRRDSEGQQLLRGCVEERGRGGDAAGAATEPEPRLPNFRAFASSVLGWNFSPAGYAGTEEAPIPTELEAVLSEGGEVLRPDFAVRAEPDRGMSAARPESAVRESAAGYSPAASHESTAGDGAERERTATNSALSWQLLVRVCEPSEDFDHVTRGRSRANGGLEASSHGRMERLLRHTGVAAGLLFNGTALRLISAPRGESSGWLDFRVADMLPTAGRPISTAMRLLLGQTRLLSVPRPKRLAALLEDSRKFQNEVSVRLAEQVLHALYELLRGFQAAHDTSKGGLLREPLAENPDEVYRGLLTVVLRLVFLLYAEERDMLPQDETFLGAYSLAGLYERLREDAALNPDTMDQRFGGYAQLLALFRMVHDGARAGAMRLPPRHGALFDPDRYRFLEGRGAGGARQIDERIDPPLVPDGTIYRVLEKLIVLDGERISYRALDVEHVGSVYETMMGFRLETAEGLTVAIRAAKKQGAPAAVNLNALLDQPPATRAKWLQERTDRKLTDRLRRAARDADTMEALHAALDPVIDRNATPDLVPEGAMVLQPSEERRRSGSHYTPRELTEPIVRTALAPIFDRLRAEGGGPLRPEQILDLKVCDPAMGSGAFLVEACRQLGDALVAAWQAHDSMPEIPPDENEIIFARRQVAQRCLYGVDRNPKAVDLAKLSLWLVTLAKDHPLTFLDHALRPGDALVGLSRRQLDAFHWKDDAKPFQAGFEAMRAREHLARASELRRCIREADDSVSEMELRHLCDDARYETDNVRLLGDLALAAFFEGSKPKQREDLRRQFGDAVQREAMHSCLGWLEELRRKEPPLAPFHWEIEFPEVFDRENPGFDSVVGNPPFAGKNTVAAANVAGYPDWLKQVHEESHGNADLVAHFFRRAFGLLRTGGTSGLIATNTIAQGDTRSTGLRWICTNGGELYEARRRVKWPGLAAVVVSVLHVHKGRFPGVKLLDGEAVDTITAFLFHRGGHDDPARLEANATKSFVGSYVLGMGFTFDDTDTKGVATPLAEMLRLMEEEPRNRDAIFPFLGGEEVNTSPTHTHHRYVINFRDYPLRREDLGMLWAEADEIHHRRTSPMDVSYIELAKQFIGDYWPHLTGFVVPAVATAVFAHIRRPNSTARDTGPYFTETKLLTPPLVRPAYSDRMAYVLAEMSDLAYYQFEGEGGFIEDAVQAALERNLADGQDIRQFLDQFSTELMSGRRLSLEAFGNVLANSGFLLVDVINIRETQGFVCKRNVADEPPYLVLAFRGTEKKISDWLTDARCIPAVEGKTRVHSGFQDAFTKNVDAEGRTVEDLVREILDRPEAKDNRGKPLPLFITGHSLGGALALLATRLIAPDATGACYTFGAPRIGNYECFRFIKTPVYRVVNSSDVVPRVPPGAVMLVLTHVVKGASWLTGIVPPVSLLFDKLEELLDKLKGYRHYGDVRYLTDVAEGRFDTVRLLTNPPAIDRLMWMGRHISHSVLVPVKSHSMSIYRKKLASIANDRNRVRGG